MQPYYRLQKWPHKHISAPNTLAVGGKPTYLTALLPIDSQVNANSTAHSEPQTIPLLALLRQNISCVYQPLFSCKCCCPALFMWTHPDRIQLQPIDPNAGCPRGPVSKGKWAVKHGNSFMTENRSKELLYSMPITKKKIIINHQHFAPTASSGCMSDKLIIPILIFPRRPEICFNSLR